MPSNIVWTIPLEMHGHLQASIYSNIALHTISIYYMALHTISIYSMALHTIPMNYIALHTVFIYYSPID